METPSVDSSESFFSVRDVKDPIDPRFAFVNEFVLLVSLIIDFDRVTTITTSARGDCKDNEECEKQKQISEDKKVANVYLQNAQRLTVSQPTHTQAVDGQKPIATLQASVFIGRRVR
jgi:hypothetical protein